MRTSLALALGRDLLLAAAVCALAILVTLSLQLRVGERDLRQRSLAEAARYVEQHIAAGPTGELRLPAAPGSSWSSFGYPTMVFAADGQLLYSRPAARFLDPPLIAALADQRLPTPKAAGGVRFFNLNLGTQRIIGAVLHSSTPGRSWIIIVFKDEHAPDVLVDDVIRDFPYRSAQVLGIVFTLLLVGGGLIIRRRMRPVAAVSRLADRIGPGTLDLRLPERDLPAEVQPIVRAVNGALARLERAAEAQREFLGRAAHQLRTPLTVLGARVAQLDDSGTTRELRRDVRELGRILTQLLQFNEIDALPVRAGDRADLAAVGEAVCEELREMAAKHDVTLRLIRPERRTLSAPSRTSSRSRCVTWSRMRCSTRRRERR
ncbi:MAG: histidine kinase dimerization/phospho-acceptor domain-containing protein [Thiohalocapsa sp.]